MVTKETVPLSPSQRQDLSRGTKYVRKNFVFELFHAREKIEPNIMIECLREIGGSQEVFRHRFFRSNDGWRQFVSCEHSSPIIHFEVQTVEGCSDDIWRAESVSALEKMQLRTDIERGPLAGVILMECASEQKVLIFMNHLISDNCSLNLFVKNIAQKYTFMSRNEKEDENISSSSFREWCKYCHDRENSGDFEKNIRRYFSDIGGRTVRLKEVSNLNLWPLTVEDREFGRLNIEFEKKVTEKLLRTLYSRYKVWPVVGLLSILGSAMSSRVDGDYMPITIQESGRLIRGTNLNVDGTIGYLTYCTINTIPVNVNLRFDEIVSGVARMYRSVQKYGLDAGIGIYSTNNGNFAREKYSELSPRLWFNYLGQSAKADSYVERLLRRERAWPLMPTYGSEGFATLGVVALVDNGALRIRWEYCTDAFHKQYVEALSAEFEKIVHHLID